MQNFQKPLLQVIVTYPAEIILKCFFDVQETFYFIFNIENSFAA